jgi:RimJ/RimL family protein N-acetyltransferase
MPNTLPLVITTDRLLLRPLAEADVDAMTRIYAAPAVHRFLGGKPSTRPEVWRQVALSCGHRELRGYTMLAVVDRSTGELLGRSGPWFPDGWPQLEVGWVVAAEHQGKGIATEAGRASLRWCFDVLRAEWVCSLIRAGNEPSRRVAASLGGRIESVIEEFFGEPADVWVHRPQTLTAGRGDEATWHRPEEGGA